MIAGAARRSTPFALAEALALQERPDAALAVLRARGDGTGDAEAGSALGSGNASSLDEHVASLKIRLACGLLAEAYITVGHQNLLSTSTIDFTASRAGPHRPCLTLEHAFNDIRPCTLACKPDLRVRWLYSKSCLAWLILPITQPKASVYLARRISNAASLIQEIGSNTQMLSCVLCACVLGMLVR